MLKPFHVTTTLRSGAISVKPQPGSAACVSLSASIRSFTSMLPDAAPSLLTHQPSQSASLISTAADSGNGGNLMMFLREECREVSIKLSEFLQVAISLISHLSISLLDGCPSPTGVRGHGATDDLLRSPRCGRVDNIRLGRSRSGQYVHAGHPLVRPSRCWTRVLEVGVGDREGYH